MGQRGNLEVVTADTPRRRRKALTITQAAESGTRRDLLVALRKRLAETLEGPNCPSRDLSPLTRRLMEIDAEIKAADVRNDDEDTPTADEPFHAGSV